MINFLDYLIDRKKRKIKLERNKIILLQPTVEFKFKNQKLKKIKSKITTAGTSFLKFPNIRGQEQFKLG
ncbi:unnamed protein product [Meloidogyne enterolobii]|uniref:Uncharacterized protein n=1 Tax=Meloidogyne enterolobii TaxID=390850 RepID=A0ACB0ZAR1_MELEN